MNILPTTIDEAIDILTTFYSKNIEEIKKMSEDKFVSSSHFGAGMFIRNEWFLWWHPNHEYKEWPKNKPELNKEFEKIGINHADDMSSILMISFHRKLTGKPLNIESQVKRYHDHWKQYGFPDGIYKPD